MSGFLLPPIRANIPIAPILPDPGSSGFHRHKANRGKNQVGVYFADADPSFRSS